MAFWDPEQKKDIFLRNFSELLGPVMILGFQIWFLKRLEKSAFMR